MDEINRLQRQSRFFAGQGDARPLYCMSGAELFFSAVGPGAVKEADGVAAAMSRANVTSPP